MTLGGLLREATTGFLGYVEILRKLLKTYLLWSRLESTASGIRRSFLLEDMHVNMSDGL